MVEIVMFVVPLFFKKSWRHTNSGFSFVVPCIMIFFTGRPVYGSAENVYQNSMILLLFQLYILKKTAILTGW